MASGSEKHRWPRIFVGLLAMVGALSLLAVAGLIFFVLMMALGIGSIELGDGGSYLPARGNEKIIAGVRLTGEINSQVTDEVLGMLKEASKDKQVVGVLLEVNSPGGSVVASQEIYDAVGKIRETMPVVAFVRDMAASGGYYSCASASKIVAARGSLVGSIGVILSTMETTQLLGWLKLKPITLKTGSLKDAGSPVREWTKDDRDYLQSLIEDTRTQFAADVQNVRKMSDATMRMLSDGRVVLGTTALEMKLVDLVGTRENALENIAQLAGVKEVPELVYMEKRKHFGEVLGQLLEEQSRFDLRRELTRELSKELHSVVPPPQLR